MTYCRDCLALRESEHGTKKWDKELYIHKDKCMMCGQVKMCCWVSLDALSNIGLGEVDMLANFTLEVISNINKAKELLNTNISDMNPMKIYKELEEAENRLAQIGNCLMDENYDYGCKITKKVGAGGYYRRPVGNISVVVDKI